MEKGNPLIIIDNTNIKLWEMKKYVLEADKYKYEVEIQEPKTEWAWDAKKCSKRNAHGVPKEKVQMMLENFETFKNLDDIREAKDNFRRNNQKQKYKEKY